MPGAQPPQEPSGPGPVEGKITTPYELCIALEAIPEAGGREALIAAQDVELLSRYVDEAIVHTATTRPEFFTEWFAMPAGPMGEVLLDPIYEDLDRVAPQLPVAHVKEIYAEIKRQNPGGQ